MSARARKTKPRQASKRPVKPPKVQKDAETLAVPAVRRETREQRRRRFLDELAADIELAKRAEKWAAVANMRATQARAYGLQIPPPERPFRSKLLRDNKPEDTLEAYLDELRSMLSEARSRGAMTASARLAAQIKQVILEIEQRRIQKEKEAMIILSDEEVIRRLEDTIAHLPESIVLRLRSALNYGEPALLTTGDANDLCD